MQSFSSSWGAKTLNLAEDTCQDCTNLRELATLEALNILLANPYDKLSCRLRRSLSNHLPSSPIYLLAPLKQVTKVSWFYMVVSVSYNCTPLLSLGPLHFIILYFSHLRHYLSLVMFHYFVISCDFICLAVSKVFLSLPSHTLNPTFKATPLERPFDMICSLIYFVKFVFLYSLWDDLRVAKVVTSMKLRLKVHPVFVSDLFSWRTTNSSCPPGLTCSCSLASDECCLPTVADSYGNSNPPVAC